LQNPDALLLAEVYQPQLYRDYIKLGKMDYLYDKVGFYDSLKRLMQGKGTASEVLARQAEVTDIDQHMLKFLENHDEQRIASPEFAGSAEKGKPAMVVSTLIGQAPTLLYFGQEVGEAGTLDAGFGKPSRTSIFDYVGVPAHQGWLNGGKYDGGGLTADQAALRTFYQQLLKFSSEASALNGEFVSLHQLNLTSPGYSEQQLSFARFDGKQQLLVVSNFAEQPVSFKLQLPAELRSDWHIEQEPALFQDLFSSQQLSTVPTSDHGIKVELAPLSSMILIRKH
jgi:glycosidase